MGRAVVQRLCGDTRTAECRAFESWLTQAAKLARRFRLEADDDPFIYNETASVSLLTAAAAMAGMLALAEYEQEKRHRNDGRKVSKGRSDLWLQSPGRSWGIEVKQFTPSTSLSDVKRGIIRQFGHAQDDARRLPSDVADRRVACLIVPTSYADEGEDMFPGLYRVLEDFSGAAHWSWMLDYRTEATDRCYIYFLAIE